MAEQVKVSKRLMVINSASSAVAHFLNISVLLWLHQYLLKRISAEEYSIYPVVMSIMIFLPLLTTVLTSGLSRFLVEAYSADDNRRVTQIVSTMFPILLASGLLIFALGETFAWYIGDILTIPDNRLFDARLMMGLLMMMAAIRIPLVPFGAGLHMRQNFVLINMIQVGSSLLRIVLLFTLLLGVSTRVLWVVVASVTSNLISLIVIQILSQRRVPYLRFRISEIRWELLREIMTFSMWSFLANLAYKIRQSADPLILNKLASPVDVTVFYVGSLCRRQIDNSLEALYIPLYPALTALHAQRGMEMMRYVYLRGGRLALWLVMFMAVPLMVYSQEVVDVYLSGKYETAATIMILTLAGYILSLGSSMIWKLAYASNQVHRTAWRAILGQSLTLCITLYLVGSLKMGAIGSALSTFSVSLFTSTLLVWPLGIKMVETTWGEWMTKTMAPGLCPAAVGLLIWWPLKFAVQPDNWVNLGLCAGAGCAVYLLVLWAFCMQPDDRADLRNVLGKIGRVAKMA